MDQVRFFYGQESDLPISDIIPGAFYYCYDTKNTYRGTTTTSLELYSSAIGYVNGVTNQAILNTNTHCNGIITSGESLAPHRGIYFSTSLPDESQGANGDIWIVYES